MLNSWAATVLKAGYPKADESLVMCVKAVLEEMATGRVTVLNGLNRIESKLRTSAPKALFSLGL